MQESGEDFASPSPFPLSYTHCPSSSFTLSVSPPVQSTLLYCLGTSPFLLCRAQEEEEEDMEEKARARRAAKPADWRALFSGNHDDHFRLGIKLTRGSIRECSHFSLSHAHTTHSLFCMHNNHTLPSLLHMTCLLLLPTSLRPAHLHAGLFSDLFQSDIIVASPISLATKLAEDQAASGGKQSPDSDFLSSIEVLVIDRADMLCMQVRGDA